jgi:serine/threonine-protein kinase
MAVPEPNDAPDEGKLFPVLDAYLEELHSGRRPDRSRWLAEHPELAEVLDCLDGLDRLAPPSQAPDGAGPPPFENAPTDRLEPADPGLTLDFRGEPAGPGPGPSPLPGPRGADFGKYELLAEIGRGGMGVVYKARQKDLDRVVAVKMILSSHLASAEHVDRFHAEARAAASLHHPHVVGIFEAGEIHGQHYFAMQYVAGPSLAQLTQKGPLKAEEAARLVAAVARAVHHLHAQGIVHRDLKPSNILLDEHGQPYVTDFGLVKMLGESHQTGTGVILGTPSYMSPEQAAGQADRVGPLSDVYSLGAILYELLTGRTPFRGATPLDVLVQVLESEAPPPRRLNPAVPHGLEMICLRCLENTPPERYPSAAALAEDLERFLGGEEVEARPPGPWQRLQRWARREPALASRLGALAVCCAIVEVKYHTFPSLEPFLHLEILTVLGLWALASVMFQRLLGRDWAPEVIPLAWSGTDVVLLTAVLVLDDALTSPLIVGYPLLVAASGLWFRVPLVWFTTAIAVAGYAVLVLDAWRSRPAMANPHHHVIFMVALAVLGFVVAYQVKRVRVLSRYYEHRPLP